MKNNYNPYTVPENFFEESGKRAITRINNRRRAIKYSAAAMLFAAILITPLFIHTHQCRVQETQTISNSLADMYEYDIFLQVNFTR